MAQHTLRALICAASLCVSEVAAAHGLEPAAEAPAPASDVPVEDAPVEAEAEAAPAPTPEAPPAATTTTPPPAPGAVDHHLRHRRGRDMMIAGFTVFGGLYLLSAFSGAITYDQCNTNNNPDCGYIGKALILPVVGPFIAVPKVDKLSAKMAIVVFPGLGQITGLALGIAGAVLFGKSRKYVARVNADGVQLVQGRQLRLNTMGTPRGDGGGLQLTLRF
ncbi:MAG: hypothetical protein R3B09_12135 [Nannocystaceae bacterium]